MGQNYFNSLPFRRQIEELAKCRFMAREEFSNGCDYLQNPLKKYCNPLSNGSFWVVER